MYAGRREKGGLIRGMLCTQARIKGGARSFFGEVDRRRVWPVMFGVEGSRRLALLCDI